MARTTKLTETVQTKDRILPVESSEGFRADDWARLNGERLRVARVPNDHLIVVVHREPGRSYPSFKGAILEREE